MSKVLLSKVLLAWVDEEKDRLTFLCGGQLLRGEERVGQLLGDTVLVRYRGILIWQLLHAGCLESCQGLCIYNIALVLKNHPVGCPNPNPPLLSFEIIVFIFMSCSHPKYTDKVVYCSDSLRATTYRLTCKQLLNFTKLLVLYFSL